MSPRIRLYGTVTTAKLHNQKGRNITAAGGKDLQLRRSDRRLAVLFPDQVSGSTNPDIAGLGMGLDLCITAVHRLRKLVRIGRQGWKIFALEVEFA